MKESQHPRVISPQAILSLFALQPPGSSLSRLRPHLGVLFVLLLFFPLTALNVLYLDPILTYSGFLVLALAAAVAALSSSRFRQLFLLPARPTGLSLISLLALVGFLALTLAWNPVELNWKLLAYPLLSGVAQELYFRCSLLAVLSQLYKRAEHPVLLAQSFLFALWHVRAFTVVGPLLALATIAGTFAVGYFWGWRVLRERTVLYVALQHVLFLTIVWLNLL